MIRKIVPFGFISAMVLTIGAALPATAAATTSTSPSPSPSPSPKCTVTLAKSVDKPAPAPGGNVTFTIKITATDCGGRFVSIHDDNRPGEQLFPTSLTLVSATPAPSHSDPQHLRWFLTGSGVVPSHDTATLTDPSITQSSATGTIQIVATVPAAAACGTAIVNTATAASFVANPSGSGGGVPTTHIPQASAAATVKSACPTTVTQPTSSSGLPGLPNTGRPAQD